MIGSMFELLNMIEKNAKNIAETTTLVRRLADEVALLQKTVLETAAWVHNEETWRLEQSER